MHWYLQVTENLGSCTHKYCLLCSQALDDSTQHTMVLTRTVAIFQAIVIFLSVTFISTGSVNIFLHIHV
jgi:hypothetical protein